jgi:hypothetical protein
MTLLSALLLLPFTHIGEARAAELTELAPALRGDVSVRYDLDAAHADLLEGDEQVGRRVLQSHTITWAGSFSPIDGAALFVEMPHIAAERVRYPQAAAMAFDPAADQGTMLGTPTIDDPAELRGAGVGGVWLGVRGTPLSEALWSARGDRTTWLLEAGYRFRDKTNLWTYGPRGTRGAGPGAPAFRLLTTVSATKGDAEPYVRARWVRSSRINTDIVDAQGRTVATGLELRPESTFDLGVGTELEVSRYGEDGARVALDFRGTLAYHTWQDIPSGIYLPDVLDASVGQVATQSERVTAAGQFGVNWRFHEYVQLNVAGEVGVHTPYRAEHFYPVDAGTGLLWGVTSSLRFRLRDPMFDRLAPATPDTPAVRPAPLATPPVGG